MSGLMPIRFGGFLGRRPSGGRSLSTGCHAVSPRQDIDRCDPIGVFAVSAFEAMEPLLRRAVRRLRVPTCRTLPAGVLRRYGDEDTAAPRQLVFELAAELELPLIENRAIEARFGPDVSARMRNASRCRVAHVLHLQVLDAHHRVVFC
jgi:hypothetical protein